MVLVGPIDIVDAGGRSIPGGGPKEQTVLAALALSPGVAVSRYAIAEALWGDVAPASADQTLRSYVSRLHRASPHRLGLTQRRNRDVMVSALDRRALSGVATDDVTLADAVRLDGTVSLGSVDRFLGDLADGLGRRDDAEAHFRVALDLEEGLRATAYLVRTRLAYARMLARRGQAADLDTAPELLDSVLEDTERLGMRSVHDEARAARAALGP